MRLSAEQNMGMIQYTSLLQQKTPENQQCVDTSFLRLKLVIHVEIVDKIILV